MAGSASNKNRKYGKNLKDPSMKEYNRVRRDLKNKILKLEKHLKNQPNDLKSVGHLKRLSKAA